MIDTDSAGLVLSLRPQIPARVGCYTDLWAVTTSGSECRCSACLCLLTFHACHDGIELHLRDGAAWNTFGKLFPT